MTDDDNIEVTQHIHADHVQAAGRDLHNHYHCPRLTPEDVAKGLELQARRAQDRINRATILAVLSSVGLLVLFGIAIQIKQHTGLSFVTSWWLGIAGLASAYLLFNWLIDKALQHFFRCIDG